MCILSVSSAFGVHVDISIHPNMHMTPEHVCKDDHHIRGDTKDNVCLTEEHGANKALTYPDLEPHKETD